MPAACFTSFPTSSSATAVTGGTTGAAGTTGISGATSGITAGGASGAIAVPIDAPGAAGGVGARPGPVMRLTAWTAGGTTRCKICPAGPVAAASATSLALNSPPVAAWLASMTACVAPAPAIAPGIVTARPAGVNAASAEPTRGISPNVNPGVIAYSFWSRDERIR